MPRDAEAASARASDDRLTGFLYWLMRDELPVGRVQSIVDQLEGHESFRLTNPELAAIARRFAEALRRG